MDQHRRTWVYDAERYGRLDDARQAEQAAMVEYQSITTCRMTFLREQLDDPGLTSENSQCGRCDNCTGNRYDTTVDTAALDETRARLQRPGFDLEPRKMWPTGLSKLGVKLSGKITEGGPETGRILGRMSDLGWGGQRLRALFDGPDARYPMRWSARVSAFWPPGIGPSDPPVSWPRIHDASFVGVEPGCQVGRGRAIDRPGHPSLATRPPSVSAANSAYRVSGLVDVWEVPDMSIHQGPILLVDAIADTGWTFTMAARALRQAGAHSVLPLALASPK